MKKRIPRAMLQASVAALVLAVPALGRSQTLTHRYSFNDNPANTTFVDSVGGANWTGTNMGTAILDGSQLQLDGGGWAQLPAGMVSSYSQVTIEFWATFSGSNPYWTRVFAFGNQTAGGGEDTGLDYCHYAGGNWQNLNIQTNSAGTAYANNPGGLNGQTNVHVTVVVDPPSNNMYYFNGTTLMSTLHGPVPPLNGINDTLCLLGKSLFDLDSPLSGSLDEFRVYQGVITPSALAINDAAGANNYIVNPGALQAIHFISPDNPVLVNQNSQQVFTGDFANVSGVNLIAYGGATFTSGNPSVLTVSAAGVVSGISPGTTTVVASFGGMSATNTLTVVAVPAALAHRYSFTTDASDSVGGANGTLQGSATVSGGQLVLDGSAGTYLDLPGDAINIATNRAVTIDAWVTFGQIPQWCRLFDFGADGGSTEIYFAPSSIGNGGDYRISENISGGQTFDWRGEWTNASLHLTCVFDPPSSTMAVYKNGKLEYARHDANASLSLVATNLAVIGRSLVAVDPYMPGSVDELRIYSGALTPQEIALDDQNGPNSTVHDPGTLNTIQVVATTYPAYSPLLAPTVLANYANLPNFKLLPTTSAAASGLSLTSSDPTVLKVLGNNMVQTFRPGTVTLTASYLGKTSSATIQVKNVGTLTHRYNFNTDTSDSVGTASGVLHGTASVSGGSLVLDGNTDSYLELPPALIDGYDAVTIDTWVTFGTAQTWARLWYFGDDRANEFYIAPSVNGGSAHWFSAGIPTGGNTITIAPQWQNQTLHITAFYGNGLMEYYTNGVLHGSSTVTGPLSEVGNWFSWIGKSPYADPFVIANVDEFRVYHGRLAPDEIQASDILGPDTLLSTSPATLQATVSGGNILLSWPVAAAGFSVQARSSFSSGGWATLTNAPTLVGNTWQVTLPTSGAAQFYRLWR